MYYGEASASQLAFTREEAGYIQDHTTLRVAYCDGWLPVSFTGDGQQFSGICAGIMDLLSQRSGIQFEYIPAENERAASRLLASGEVDIICGLSGHRPAEAGRSSVLLTKPFVNVRITLFKPPDMPLEEVSAIAVSEARLTLAEYVQQNYPDAEIVFCIDAGDCSHRRGERRFKRRTLRAGADAQKPCKPV